jgi:aryl-alcohol dehydrogenase-like predicted oxidoreductase
LARWTPAKLAYGGTRGIDEERRAFEASVAAGVTLFDTAAFYSGGASERRLGEFARGKDVLIATKFPPSPFSRTDDMPKELDASRARLGRDVVDLYQHHFPSSRVSIPKLMELMVDAVEAGKVKAVGVSNYTAEQMRLAHAVLAKRGIPLASNQVEYSLLHGQPEANGVLDACRELGVTLIAYQPLASGALTGKYLTGARPTGLRRFTGTFRGRGLAAVAPVVALLREIGERYAKSPAQVALRWLIENENVLPIPGAKNGKQAAENAEAL